MVSSLLLHCDDEHRAQVEAALTRAQVAIQPSPAAQAELVVLPFSPNHPFPLTEAPILALVKPEQAVAALQAGAWDVVFLPLQPQLLELRATALLEANALQREKEQAEKDLKEFLYVASHDLGAPLRTVLMYLDLLRSLHGEALDEDATRVLERTHSAAWGMHEMIEGLLNLSRTVSQPMSMESVDLQAQVTGALTQLVHLREGAQIEVGALPMATSDPRLIGRVLQELLSNALKFRGSGPHKVELRAGLEAGMLWLEVQDNGVGMPERGREKVTQPFGRLHGRSEFPGHGLGLAVVTRALQRMGGTMQMESTQGVGTQVRVELPQ